jgi:Ser/Thr protein kinase RdoA (MazF antagonist)
VDKPPNEVLDAAGFRATDCDRLPWQVPIWKVSRGETAAVLRRTRLDTLFSLQDLRWQHQLRIACGERGLRVPLPLPAFDGDTTMTCQGFVWEVLSYLPGVALGWQSKPTLREVGALLARFHTASADLGAALGQRPSAVPLSQLSVYVDLRVIDASLQTPEARMLFRRHLEDITADVAVLDRTRLGAGVVHGDFTTLNLLVDGRPPRISGIIDFNNAYCEALFADLGFCLWQAGRPAHERYLLDLRRVAEFVAGYCSETPLPSSAASTVAIAIRARGLQLMVRSSLRGPHDLLRPLELVDWVARHTDELETAAAAGLSE